MNEFFECECENLKTSDKKETGIPKEKEKQFLASLLNSCNDFIKQPQNNANSARK